MSMSLNEILDAVKGGTTCPFTKKPYDCARCEYKKYRTDWFNKGKHTCHFGLCITVPLHDGANGWRRVLKYFEPKDRKEARELLTQLLKFGVEMVPFGECDAERLAVRPKSGMLALMVEYEDGEKEWYHITPRLLGIINDRLARRNDK